MILWLSKCNTTKQWNTSEHSTVTQWDKEEWCNRLRNAMQWMQYKQFSVVSMMLWNKYFMMKSINKFPVAHNRLTHWQ